MTKILFIDDDPDVLELYKMALESYQVEVDTFLGGEHVVLKVRSSRPDIIFLDYDMPKVKGPDVIKRLRAEEDLRHIPIVMLTGKDQNLEECFRGGANGFLSKSSTFLHLEVLKWIDILHTRGKTA